MVSISNHSQVTWGQSVEQVRDGFLTDLYALQGYRDTWYTGGLWCPDYSSNVWAFTRNAESPRNDTVLLKYLAEAPSVSERLAMSPGNAKANTETAAVVKKREETMKYLDDWQASWDRASQKGKAE